MQQSRRELLDDFVAFVGEPRDADARDVAERLLNRCLTGLWLQRPWRAYRSPVPYELPLVAGTLRYMLPDHFGRIGPGEARSLTTGRRLRLLRDGEREALFPLSGTSLEVRGVPEALEMVGQAGVHTQPAAAGEALEVLSSSAADTDVVAAVAGEDTAGRWSRTQVTLLGTTPVAVGTWRYVDEFAKAFVATATPDTELTSSRGTVTLRKVTGAVERQRLLPQQSSQDHDVLIVASVPAAADTIAVPFIRKPKRLLHDADPLPDLWAPALFEEMLIEWQVNTGDLTPDAAARTARPQLEHLVAYENQNAPRPWKRGFAG